MLERINSPYDLKKLKIGDFDILSQEIREVLLNKLSKTGGHVGPNLGFVEPTIALHYVFDFLKDKIVFDVSHQAYVHKILTGRKDAFVDQKKFGTVSGFTNPAESPYDIFEVGHTSTSVSLALGLAKARDINKEKFNVICVIGDGSLSGGEAFEGLDNAAKLNSNFIIVVNDNEMSISPNFGGLYTNLDELRKTNGLSENNFFKSLGFDYRYLENGNNVESLIKLFESVKDIDHPIVLHIHTLKGKGYKFAEENKEKWHFSGPFDLKTGKSLSPYRENYTSITQKYFEDKIQKDSKIVLITAAIAGVCGFNGIIRNYQNTQFIDVGICEEHAIAFASGLAKGNVKPIIGMSASFIQRTYDQLVDDLCLNDTSVTILVFNSGMSCTSATHNGIYDISMLSNIPNLSYLSPRSKEEYLSLLDYLTSTVHKPVAIKLPSYGVYSYQDKFDEKDLANYKIINKGSEIAILPIGNCHQIGQELLSLIKEKLNVNATLIHPLNLSSIDENTLNGLKKDHRLIITIEDGILDGGFGQKIAQFYGTTDIKVLNYGFKKDFYNLVNKEEVFSKNHVNPGLILDDIKKIRG